VLVHSHRRDRGDQQRTPVGRRVLERGDADASRASGTVLHDDRAAERGAHFVGGNSCKGIAGATSREREDDSDGLLNDLARRREWRQTNDRRERKPQDLSPTHMSSPRSENVSNRITAISDQGGECFFLRNPRLCIVEDAMMKSEKMEYIYDFHSRDPGHAVA